MSLQPNLPLLTLLAVNQHLQYSLGQSLVQYQLADLYKKRGIEGIHLFPTLTSTLYPGFAGFKRELGYSRIHMTESDVREYSTKRLNGSEITSICSYTYMGTAFYVINTDIATGDTVEYTLNLTMADLERNTEEMMKKRMKPSHICRGPNDRFQTVWRGSQEIMRHYLVQEGEIRDVFEEDVKHGREGYYPVSLQVYRSENQTTALMIWEKGFGVRYRIQSGSNLTDMDSQMHDSRMKPTQISTLPGKSARHLAKHYVVWHSDEFSWEEKNIPRAALTDSLAMNVTELDLAVEQQMRFFNIPSISLCIYRRGKRLLSISYGYSDLRSETKAHPLNSYRIASISKTITAMGIAELINRRLLTLDSKVFGQKGVLSFNVNNAHPWLRYVTVRHLLEHSSGGWGNMDKIEFNKTPQTKELNGTALIDFYIKAYEPKFQPGTRFLYSNIAYVMLGQVIEQISLRPYEEFIQDVILNPNKIEARIGDVEPGKFEVSYYSPDNANPYTYWTPFKLNAAAGWVMRAEEVARLFMLLESGKNTKYRMLTQPSVVRPNYGQGLQLGNDDSLYHLGSLAGSEGIGYSRWDLQVAILTNMRGRERGERTAWMQRLCQLFAKHAVVP